jgi:hypothetical protein
LEGLAIEDVGLFYGHLVYIVAILVSFMVILYILWPFGNFFPFWHFVPRKIWQPRFKVCCRGDKCSVHQGDKIGRIFAHRAFAYFGQSFIITKVAQIFGHFFHGNICVLILSGTGLGDVLGDFVSRTHRVTLPARANGTGTSTNTGVRKKN